MATCSVEADQPPSTRTPHPQVLSLIPVNQIRNHFKPLNFSDSVATDYFSLKSWSRPSSPAPSVAGSFTSSSSSARHRRPLISPARLNISSPSLCLFSTKLEPSLKASPPPTSSYLHEDQTSVYSGRFSPDIPLFQSQNST